MLVADSPASWECRPGAAHRALPPGYRRREPEATLLYALVTEHLDDLLVGLATASPYGHGLPRHVEKELRAFLDCGRLEKGFARVVCRSCRAEHLVAFSCLCRYRHKQLYAERRIMPRSTSIRWGTAPLRWSA